MCLLRSVDQGHFLGCVVSDLGLIALWNSSVVSKKTGCSSGFRVNQYKHVRAFSLSLISLISILIFANWYKQPIVFFSGAVVFALCFGKLNFLSFVSRSNFILGIKVCENPL